MSFISLSVFTWLDTGDDTRQTLIMSATNIWIWFRLVIHYLLEATAHCFHALFGCHCARLWSIARHCPLCLIYWEERFNWIFWRSAERRQAEFMHLSQIFLLLFSISNLRQAQTIFTRLLLCFLVRRGTWLSPYRAWEAEVAYFNRAIFIDEDVSRFHVPM